MAGDELKWLLAGDPAIAYQARRDLLDDDDPRLRRRIATGGWGARYLELRNPDGSWARGFYQPKWTCSHYTLLDLRNLCLPPDNELARASVHKIALEEKRPDGGVGPARSSDASDVCVAGMFLNYAAYFGEPELHLQSVVDFLLSQQMDDGGFNCLRNITGARHSSLHSSLSVAEGIEEYARNGHTHRLKALRRAGADAREFMLGHRLFRSHRTGEVISPRFLELTFPARWKFNILRALDHFRLAGHPWDDRLEDALQVLVSRRRPDGRWLATAARPGEMHFRMETPRSPGRWNTLLALRVLRAYGGHLGASLPPQVRGF